VAAVSSNRREVSTKNFSIVDEPGANSWPISGYSWVMVYKKPSDPNRGKLLYGVLTWLVGPQGQSNAKSVDYVPLPGNVQSAALSSLRQMQH
jgi:phosphate transport system substrate-binding protein